MAKFSNFYVEVEGYGGSAYKPDDVGGIDHSAAMLNALANARARAPAEIILTKQSSFLQQTSEEIIKIIKEANASGKNAAEVEDAIKVAGMNLPFHDALGEKLVYKQINFSDKALGKKPNEAAAMVELLKYLEQNKLKFIDLGHEIAGSGKSFKVADLDQEEDADTLKLWESMGILTGTGDPEIVYATTLRFLVQVDKLRDLLMSLTPSVIQKRTAEEFIGEAKDDVTPVWLREPGTETIDSNKLFKPPFFKSITELAKYDVSHVGGMLPEEVLSAWDEGDFSTEKADQAAIDAGISDFRRSLYTPLTEATHMVATPITLLGKTALDNALKHVGATVKQTSDIFDRLKESTLQNLNLLKNQLFL